VTAKLSKFETTPLARAATTRAAGLSTSPATGPVRQHGCTPEQRETFLANLADTGVVTKSARAAELSKATVYAMRRVDEDFAKRWDEALNVLPSRVLDAVVEEAIEGEPIMSAEGHIVGRRRNARLLERLAEKHGIIDKPGPATAVQVNNNNTQQAARDPKVVAAVRANNERLRALLHREPLPALPTPAVVAVEIVDVANEEL
jgi:hypothetical protein